MSIRTAIATLGGALVLVLTGCVGIPMSGGVNDGDEIDLGGDVPTVLLPSGPRPGATQTEVLTDFIQAATNPANDYETARQFLAPSVRESWNPDAVVTISTSTGLPALVTDTSVLLRFSTSARVEADGRYLEEVEPDPVEFAFAFTQVDGEWRISELDDGVVVTAANFRRVFAAHPLFFFDPSYSYLVPDVRWFATTANVPARIALALVTGPSAWLGQGVVVSAFPVGTQLKAVVADSSTAVVDLSEEARQATDDQRRRMRQQLSASLANVANIAAVEMTIDGVTLQVGDDGSQVATQPSINASPLVLQGEQFGFATSASISTIDGVSEQVAAVGARAAVYALRTKTAALLADQGVVRVSAADPVPRMVDPRAGLIAPAMDNSGFIYSVQAESLASLRVWNAATLEELTPPATSVVADDARVRSMSVSRDGTRMLLYLETDAGPSLVVVGIVRQNGAPSALAGDPIVLAVSPDAPIDATWVSDRAVAALAGAGGSASITVFPLGGPSESRGFVADAVQIVGGNGEPGLRVRDAAGEIVKPSGTSWRSAGIPASFIATQQPG